MKRLTLIMLCALCTLILAAQGKKEIQFSDVMQGTFSARGISGMTPIPGDGEHFTQMTRDGQIVKYSYKTGEQVEVLFDVKTARDCPFERFDSYEFSPDGNYLLIATESQSIYRRSFTAVYYLYSLRRNTAGQIRNAVQRLSDGGPQQSPVFSPDGTMVAFVRDNNIFLVKLLYNNSESQVTTDGKRNEIINGIPDWVYEEEFSFNRALEFSSDSQMLAYIKFDESGVKQYDFPLFAGMAPHNADLEKYPGSYVYKYPKTGEANSKVSVHTFDFQSRVTRKMEVPINEDSYIPRIRFTKNTDQLAIMTLNRQQNQFDLYICNPRSTNCRLILRDETDTYIKEDILDNIQFFTDGFTFMSERNGHNHLYWYNLNGELQKQITDGNYEITNFLGYAPTEGAFYFQSNEGSPLRKAIYKVDKKGKKTCLTPREGTNSAQFSSDMKYFVNRYSNLSTPTIITVHDNNGKELRTLVDNKELVQRLAEYNLPTKEFFTFTTQRGDELNGWIMRPTNFNPSQKYPVLMTQYSGPGSQEVLDSFGGVDWETFMAAQGFVVACVDGRGTGGRGIDFEKCTYMQLGVKEAQDQVAAAQYLGSLPYVDSSKIGIWGWSFGGYMTLMAMSEGTPVFKAGVAVAPVTDWNYYDTVYGERFMRTPQQNFDGYKASSCMERADKLSGRLLIVHGMADDNVHFQNTAEYAEKLVQVGKQFEMQVYTNRNHSIFGGNTRNHLYTRLTEFFNRELK